MNKKEETNVDDSVAKLESEMIKLEVLQDDQKLADDETNKSNDLKEDKKVEEVAIKRRNPSDEQETSLTLDKLCLEYNSIELNWKSSRRSCTCFEPLDGSCAKWNCSRCGEISCERCAENGRFVANQVSTKPVFVCQTCLKNFSL